MRSLMCVAALFASALLSGGCATVSSCGGGCAGDCGGSTGLIANQLSNGCDSGCGDCVMDNCGGACGDTACGSGCGLGLRGRGLPRLGLFSSGGTGMPADCNDCSGVSSGPMNGVFGGASSGGCSDAGCGDCQVGMAGVPGMGRISLPRPNLGCGNFGCGNQGKLCLGCGLKGRFSGLRSRSVVADDGCGDGCADGAGCRVAGLRGRLGGLGSRMGDGDGCGCGRGCGLGQGAELGCTHTVVKSHTLPTHLTPAGWPLNTLTLTTRLEVHVTSCRTIQCPSDDKLQPTIKRIFPVEALVKNTSIESRESYPLG